MGRRKQKITNFSRILEKLNEGPKTTQQLTQELNLPSGTVRSVLSFLSRAGFIKTEIPKPVTNSFEITREGKLQLESMREEAASM